MNKQQIVGILILVLSFYVFFINNPENLTSLIDSLSKPASEFYGCKAFPFLMIFIIEICIVIALIMNKSNSSGK